VNSDIGEIVNKTGTVRIDGHDIRSTVGTKWLNDAVISAYIQLVADRSKTGNNPKVYAFNTIVFTMFGSLGYDSVRQFTKRLDIFEYDLVMFPIHLVTIGHWWWWTHFS
jgi:sentrin-specific protease 1